MSKAAKSLFVFSLYAIVMGLAFLAVPEILISILKLPPLSSGWARAIGLLVLVIGVYENVSARSESLPMIKASVYARFGFALGMLILIFSVAGIPPAAGFWGKLQVFTAGIEGGMLWLVLVGALASVVSLGYYLRLVWAMFVKPAGEPLDKTDMSVAATVAITTILVFPVLTIAIQFLLDAAARAAGG